MCVRIKHNRFPTTAFIDRFEYTNGTTAGYDNLNRLTNFSRGSLNSGNNNTISSPAATRGVLYCLYPGFSVAIDAMVGELESTGKGFWGLNHRPAVTPASWPILSIWPVAVSFNSSNAPSILKGRRRILER